MPEPYDVVVIGGGVMGCATLHYLAKKGVTNTLLLERDTLASGSTGRSMAILRTHYSNAVTVRMAQWSREIIANFDDETGHPGGFVENGYLFLPGPGQQDGMRRNVQLSQGLGVDTEMLTPAEASARWPYIDFRDQEAVAYEPRSGYADSSAVTNGFAQSARAAGAELRLGVTVTGIDQRKGRAVAVGTYSGSISCGAVVIAAGPWSTELLYSIGAPLPISYVRHQVIRLRRPGDVDPKHPTIADMARGHSFRPDSGDVSLIGAREDPAERDTYNQSVDSDVALAALHGVVDRMPGMAEAGWDGGWSGVFTITPDWHPVIDRVPGPENVFVGAGFSGHGFKMSPAIGRALAELVVDGSSRSIDITQLRFTRFIEDDLIKSSYGGTVFA